MGTVVILGVILLDEYFLFSTIPGAGPVLIGPAKHEWEIRLPRFKNLIHGALHQPVTVEPIMIITETVNAIFFRHLGLLGTHFGQAQIVESEIGGNVRLIMPAEKRLCLGHVAPLGEPFAPPCVIFGEGMKLWQMEGNDPFCGFIHDGYSRLSQTRGALGFLKNE